MFITKESLKERDTFTKVLLFQDLVLIREEVGKREFALLKGLPYFFNTFLTVELLKLHVIL